MQAKKTPVLCSINPVRSRVMAAVRSKGNRSTEQILRMALVRSGVSGWRANCRTIVGSPDISFLQEKVAVFIDGCFWHGCPWCYRRPKSHRAYWDAKVRMNMRRDQNVNRDLRAAGWAIMRFWEHELKRNVSGCIDKIQRKRVRHDRA